MPCVVSDEEKAPPRRQVGIRKANASESLMKCRKPICDIETGAYALSRDESGGCPFTGQMVSGMKAPRSWSDLVGSQRAVTFALFTQRFVVSCGIRWRLRGVFCSRVLSEV